MTSRTRGPALVLAFAAAAAIAASGLLALMLLGGGAAGGDARAAAGTDEEASAAEERQSDALVREARGLLAYDPERLGFDVAAAPPRPGVRAEIDLEAGTITAFVSPDEAPHLVAHDIAHELGHGLDRRLLDGEDRAAYLERRGQPEAAWWPAEGEADYDTGAGDLAEVFAACTAPSPEFRSTLAPQPADACALLPAAVLAKRMGAS